MVLEGLVKFFKSNPCCYNNLQNWKYINNTYKFIILYKLTLLKKMDFSIFPSIPLPQKSSPPISKTGPKNKKVGIK